MFGLNGSEKKPTSSAHCTDNNHPGLRAMMGFVFDVFLFDFFPFLGMHHVTVLYSGAAVPASEHPTVKFTEMSWAWKAIACYYEQ